MSILKKAVIFSGALSRSLIGIGAAVLLFCTIKKTKGKKKHRSAKSAMVPPKKVP